MSDRATVDLLYPGVWGRVHTGDRKDGPILFGICSVPLVRSGGLNIMVDTGHYGTRMHLLAALQRLGLGFDDIDMVVLTHPHWDHILNLEAFPKARLVVHANALEYTRTAPAHDWAVIRYLDALLKDRDVLTVSEGDELAPGVTILETPGHTTADISVVVQTADGVAVAASDSITNARAFKDRAPRLIFHDPAQAARSIDRIAEIADFVYPGHDRPFRILPDGSTEYMIDGYLDITCVEWFGDHNDHNVIVRTPLESERSVSEK